MQATKGQKIDVSVDDLVEVIFAARTKDGTIVEYTVKADTANELRYIEEEFVGALNSDGIMHLEVIGQKSGEVDRWLEQERAAARREGQAEAWDEGAEAGAEHVTSGHPGDLPNPYRAGDET